MGFFGIRNGGKTETGLRLGYGMGKNPDWISTGIRNEGKSKLNFSWNTE